MILDQFCCIFVSLPTILDWWQRDWPHRTEGFQICNPNDWTIEVFVFNMSTETMFYKREESSRKVSLFVSPLPFVPRPSLRTSKLKQAHHPCVVCNHIKVHNEHSWLMMMNMAEHLEASFSHPPFLESILFYRHHKDYKTVLDDNRLDSMDSGLQDWTVDSGEDFLTLHRTHWLKEVKMIIFYL